MGHDTITALAASLGVSKATVSRALNHCGGVDTETRDRILNAAASNGAADGSAQYAIHSLLPDTPGFFWQALRRGLADGEDAAMPMKCNVYTRLQDESTVCAYLRKAEGAQVLLVSATLSEKVREILTPLVPGRLVILLSEDDGDLPNSFYIGCNAEADGFRMGELYLARAADKTPVVLTLTDSDNRNVSRRAEGFCRALREAGHPSPQFLSIPAGFLRPIKTFPARMAALLSAYAQTLPETFCLYSAMGYANLPLVLEKTRLTSRVLLFCHDCPAPQPSADGKTMPSPPEKIFAACNQDVYAQARMAMTAAYAYLASRQYPAEKRIYVPSQLYVQPERKTN